MGLESEDMAFTSRWRRTLGEPIFSSRLMVSAAVLMKFVSKGPRNSKATVTPASARWGERRWKKSMKRASVSGRDQEGARVRFCGLPQTMILPPIVEQIFARWRA